MGIIGHLLEVWKHRLVHNGVPVFVVVVHSRGRIRRPTSLPVVVQPHVAVPQVAQGRGFAVHRSGPGRHPFHDGHYQRLVHVVPVQIPRPPPQRRGQSQAVIVRRHGRGGNGQGGKCSKKKRRKAVHPVENVLVRINTLKQLQS